MHDFTFRFSLSVLDHLGRGLYRSYSTVIAEAVSNAWDADATEVHVNTNEDSLIIWDNGEGMDAESFQNKFLKIGYSKRNNNYRTTAKGRKVLGRKGIGKLSYLSISTDINIYTKKQSGELISSKISNTKIDEYIGKGQDTEQDGYRLESADNLDNSLTNKLTPSGTLLFFNGLKPHLRKQNIRKHLAMHFHFTNILKEGDEFSIYVDGKKIGISDLTDLYKNIQFIWFADEKSKRDFKDNAVNIDVNTIKNGSLFSSEFVNEFKVHGFIASVKQPSHLAIPGSDKAFKTSVTLFAGGRMREQDLLSKIPTTQVPESYLFGQIHIDMMDDDDIDRFTSSRDNVIEDDLMYIDFLLFLKDEIRKIMQEWNTFRREINEDGDPDSPEISRIERKSEEMINLWIKNNKPIISKHPNNKIAIDVIKKHARNNFESYVECFIAENIMRFLIAKKPDLIDPNVLDEIKQWKDREAERKREANISLQDITSPLFNNPNVSYIDPKTMAFIIDKDMNNVAHLNSLSVDIKNQTPIRNPLMHTRSLTNNAKTFGKISWTNITRKIMKYLETLPE